MGSLIPWSPLLPANRPTTALSTPRVSAVAGQPPPSGPNMGFIFPGARVRFNVRVSPQSSFQFTVDRLKSYLRGALLGGLVGGSVAYGIGSTRSASPPPPVPLLSPQSEISQRTLGTLLGTGIGAGLGLLAGGEGNRLAGALLGGTLGGAAGYFGAPYINEYISSRLMQ